MCVRGKCLEKDDEEKEDEGGLGVRYSGVLQGLIELGVHFKNKVVIGVLAQK